jgi:transposase
LGHDRWLRRGSAPSWRKPKRGSALDPHVPLLERRWSEGCRNAARLWREAAVAGYAGRPGTVRAWAAQGRGEQAASGTPQLSSAAPPSGRRVGRLLMADTDKLADGERRFVARLLADAPKLADAVAVARRLHRVPRKQGGKALTDVLTAAAGILLVGFAASLGRN